MCRGSFKYQKMRDRMERLVILPFSVGCISEGSVAVGIPQPRRSTNSNSPPIIRCKGVEEDVESRLTSSTERVMKLTPKSSTISTGINRLLKGFKNLSHQFFVEKEEEEEQEAMDMEIGSPRDVQHVTHIGWDGTATANNAMMGWDNLIPPSHSHHSHHYDLIISKSKPPQTTSPAPV